MSTTIKVSLDGGLTYQEAQQGVRVIYGCVDVQGEDEQGELHLNVTREGVIADVWVSREEHLDHNIGSRAEFLDDLVLDLVEDGA